MVRLLPFLSLLAVAGASAQAAPQAPLPSGGASSASAAVPAGSGSMSMSGSAASATGSASVTAPSSSSAAAASASTATGSSSSSSSGGNNNNSSSPGYSGPISNLTAGSTISFGNHWAALHLDMINGIVASVQGTAEGNAFLDAAGRWLNAAHGSGSSNSSSSSSTTMPAAAEMQAGAGSMTGSPLLSVNDTSIQPLNILTRIYFSSAARPELHPGSAFAAIAPPATESTAAGQLVDAIQSRVLPQDIVFAKTRYYAGAGNALEEILRAQSINTVVLSGIRTSGVILATASHLIDQDYIVYVLSDAVIETPSANPFPSSNDTSATAINDALLKGVLPKLGVQVITVDDAIKAMQPASASSSSSGGAAAATSTASSASSATSPAAGGMGSSAMASTAAYSIVRPSPSSSSFSTAVAA